MLTLVSFIYLVSCAPKTTNYNFSEVGVKTLIDLSDNKSIKVSKDGVTSHFGTYLGKGFLKMILNKDLKDNKAGSFPTTIDFQINTTDNIQFLIYYLVFPPIPEFSSSLFDKKKV